MIVPNGYILSTGGPPNKTPARFIRKTIDGKLVVTKDGVSTTNVDPEQWAPLEKA